MRIAIVCNDTRGGIQPYVALGLGLQRAGHEVRAMAPSDLASMFTDAGLSAAPLSGSIEAVLRNSGGAVEGGMIASMRFAAREMPRRIEAWKRDLHDRWLIVEVVEMASHYVTSWQYFDFRRQQKPAIRIRSGSSPAWTTAIRRAAGGW